MTRNRSFGSPGAALLVVATVTLLLVSSARAQGNFKTLHSFTGGKDGSFPNGLILDQAGNLYGTTGWGGANGNGTAFKLTPNSDGSWTKSVLYSFCSLTKCADGNLPAASLIFDAAGNLYGTTSGDGEDSNGTVFKLTPNSDGSWSESVLYSFCDCGDGRYPDSSLIFDRAGNLYGTTASGGENSNGTVFKLTPNSDGSWTESVLYRFCSLTKCTDGKLPVGSLIFDAAGNLYGTTIFGGNHSLAGNCDGCGVVFKLTPSPDGRWTESVLHSFCSLTGCDDGAEPQAGLIFDAAGNLNGTTYVGGTGGGGVVFKLIPNPDGHWKEKVLHHFHYFNQGFYPSGNLSFDAAGNLYGTTFAGGGSCRAINIGCGVVFELTPVSNGGWREKVLHRFLDNPGAEPFAGVIFNGTGTLYGTTSGDGSETGGSIFEITQ